MRPESKETIETVVLGCIIRAAPDCPLDITLAQKQAEIIVNHCFAQASIVAFHCHTQHCPQTSAESVCKYIGIAPPDYWED